MPRLFHLRPWLPATRDTVDPASRVVARKEGLEVRRRYRPRTLRFQILSWLWVVPSGGALLVLAMDASDWVRASGAAARIRVVPLQSWIALGILLLQGVFIGLWRHYRRQEPWQEQTYIVPSQESACPDPASPNS